MSSVVVRCGSWWLAVRMGAVAVLCLALGGPVLYAAFLGEDVSLGTAIAGGLIGGLFVVLGLSILLSLRRVAHAGQVVLDPEGIAWQTQGDRSWSASWPELAEVRVTTAYHRARFARRFRVRLIVRPVDVEAFSAQRPQLQRLRARRGAAFDEYSLPLGPQPKIVPRLAEGLEQFAGTANGGVIDEGRVSGLGYV